MTQMPVVWSVLPLSSDSEHNETVMTGILVILKVNASKDF